MGETVKAGWEKTDLIAGVSAGCAIAVFGFGIWQYWSTEKWKKSEFVATQIKEFHSDKINEAVMLMMDYDPVRIELFPDKWLGKHVDVRFSMLVNAINEENGFTEAEFQMWKSFITYLTPFPCLHIFFVPIP